MFLTQLIRGLHVVDFYLRGMKNVLTLCFLLWMSLLTAQESQPRITLNPSLKPFYHGVESGDPMPDRVIIWTRVTPDSGMAGDIDVYWQIATDTNFTNIVNYGKLTATDAGHYCVKADVCGLQPSTYYYYMFHALGRNSIMGRTKTTPAENSDNDSVRFAVVSCSSWEHGYFNAYQKIADRNDVDAVVHLGDYIYEYATGDFSDNIAGRTYDPPTEAYDELGYELRYSQYKLDDQLRRLHQLYPFITVWDDHETANDAWREGAENHDPPAEGNYLDRKRVAVSSYFKWMPLRQPDPADSIRIFRKLRYGKLLDLIMLDTRLYDRDEQDLGAVNDTNRHIMGPVERAWFLSQLDDTSTRWKIIGNQVMFAPVKAFGQTINPDFWDGYEYERSLIINHLINKNIRDVVFLTGDIHTSWCNDVPGPNYNSSTGAGSVCVEFTGTSVTSFNLPLPIGQNIIQSLNPHVKYVNTTEKGYYVIDINKNRSQADYKFMSTVSQLGGFEVDGPSYLVNKGQSRLQQAAQAVNAPKITAPVPPLNSKQTIGFYKITDHYVSIQENQQANVNIIPSLQLCPAVTMSILPPKHGGAISLNGQDITYVPVNDYSGYDTIAIAICTTPPVSCDTVYVFVEITAVTGIDTIKVKMDDNTTYTGCVALDDVNNVVYPLTFTNPAFGTLQFSDSCLTYTADSGYCGTVPVWVYGCNTTAVCDTVLYLFEVNIPVQASVVQLQLNKNTNYLYCPQFDDLGCPPVSLTVLKGPSSGTYQTTITDSCYRYFPFFNYTGSDTMIFVGCDTCGANHCDTITAVFTTTAPPVSVSDDKAVLLGLFPNPASQMVSLQLFLYERSDVALSLLNNEGRLVQRQTHTALSPGLHHLTLLLQNLPAGIYTLQAEAAGKWYARKLVKE